METITETHIMLRSTNHGESSTTAYIYNITVAKGASLKTGKKTLRAKEIDGSFQK